MSDIDLDINNYSIRDIEKFLQLKGKYDANDIELKEYDIREQLLSSGHVDRSLKRELIEFLTAAKRWLVYTKFGISEERKRVQPIKQPPRVDEELIQREAKPFIYANPSEYFQGTINPLNTRTVSKYLSIDTRFRDNYCSTSASNFIIHLPSRLNRVVSMQLTSLEFPITFYSISSTYGNNFMYMYADTQTVEDGPIDEFETMIVLPDGSYTARDLIDTINSVLAPLDDSGNLANPDSVFSYIQLTLDVNDNGSGTGKVTIAPSGDQANIVNSIGLDFTKDLKCCNDNHNITTKLGWNLGFTQAIYCGSNVYTADTVIDLTIMRYAYLSVDDHQRGANALFFNVFHDKHINDSVLARFAMKSDTFSVMMENNLGLITEPRRYFGPVDIQRIHIQLFDDHGRHLDINNANYSFVLLFKMLYDL